MITKHDYFCRCRTCKPSLVGEQRDNRATLFALALVVILLGFAAGLAVRP